MARNINGFVGTFPTLAAVTAAFPPSESVGCSANIGTSTPYSKAWCDGAQWAGLTSAQVAAVAGQFTTSPLTNTSAGIIAAMQLVAATGKPGTVFLPAGDYAITSDIPFISGVSLVGVLNNLAVTGDVPDFYTLGSGTVFNLSAGVTAFKWNNVDKGSKETNNMDFALRNVKVYGIAFNGGLRAIDIGAINAMGALWCEFDGLVAFNQTGDYAIDIKNSQLCKHGMVSGNKTQTTLTTGGGYRIANLLGTSLLTGDSHVGEIWCRCVNNRNRGFTLEAAGVTGSILNDVKVVGRIHSSRYRGTTPDSVSMVFANASADVTVSNPAEFALLALGMPIKFQTTAPTNYDPTIVYFVTYTDGVSVIRLGEADYSSAAGIVSGSAGTFATYTSGFPTFVARADSGCAVKNSNFGDLACEISGNVVSLMFSKTRNCNANVNNPSTSFTGTGWVFRDAEMGVTYSGSSNITCDESGLSPYANTLNLSGGMFTYSGGSINLDSSWHGRQVRYTGSAAIILTIPNNMPYGFKCSVVCTNATGTVTFAVPAGGALWTKSTGKTTNGQNAWARVEMVTKRTYLLTGDLVA